MSVEKSSIVRREGTQSDYFLLNSRDPVGIDYQQKEKEVPFIGVLAVKFRDRLERMSQKELVSDKEIIPVEAWEFIQGLKRDFQKLIGLNYLENIDLIEDRAMTLCALLKKIGDIHPKIAVLLLHDINQYFQQLSLFLAVLKEGSNRSHSLRIDATLKMISAFLDSLVFFIKSEEKDVYIEAMKHNFLLQKLFIILQNQYRLNNDFSLEVDISEDIKVHSIPGDILILFQNILKNARQAGARKINVFVQENGERVEIAFCDDGGGINEKIFFDANEIFVEGKSSKRKVSGIGLRNLKMRGIEAQAFHYEGLPNNEGGAGAKIVISLPKAV